ncbi:MAG: response regulator [Fimbriimonadaceae bacterium]|nr:response regulator [Fimbriimonadaceae bacterium]
MKTILLVDDERNVLDALRRMLRAMRDEWEFLFAECFTEAAEIIQSTDLDAIVSDHNMPGKTGIDLLQHLRAGDRNSRIPFIMLTGNSDSRLLHEALDKGATDFLHKPCDAAELIARLKNVIALKDFQEQILHQNELLELRVRERTRDLERSQRDIVFRLAKAAEARDSDTGNHILRVGLFSLTLAKELGMDERFQDDILLASPLHDVGKIGISDAILRKPGSLTDEERQAMQEHCRIGAEILSEELQATFSLLSREVDESSSSGGNALLAMAANIARYHHEHWDGNGYPARVSGEDIPIEARIVAVADVYDALRSPRPYKGAMSEGETVAYIFERSGSQFDPRVVSAMMSVRDELERIRTELEDCAESARRAA